MLTSLSEKSYIGQTIKPIEERFKEHQRQSSGCKAIFGAIQKYGWDNFEKHWYEVPDEVLNDHEELMVEVLGTLAPNGYNLKEGGGSGGKWCDEVKQKISVSHKGKTLSDDHKQSISVGLTGKALSDDHKQSISDSLKGRTHTDEAKQKNRAAHTGKTHTEDAKQKMSDAHKGTKNHNSKEVYQYNIDGTFVQSFASSGEAATHLKKTSGAHIRECANGTRKTAFGFKWSYIEFL